jgi:GT2 family glycosyltransferase
VKKSILIFIITYNASFRLKDVFNKLPLNENSNKFNIKVLISDDASKDNTKTFAKKIKSVHKNIILNFNKKNKNYGGNIKYCLNYSIKNNYDYAAMIHGDDQYDSSPIFKMIKKISNSKSYAAICGSRMINKKDALKGKMPLYKFIGNIFLTKIFNFFYKTKFTDCHSGFWIYNLLILKKNNYNQLTNNYNFDNQLRIKLINNYKILEFPIKTNYKNKNSPFHLIYSFRFIIDIFLDKIFKTISKF